jgi:hypothetical protein
MKRVILFVLFICHATVFYAQNLVNNPGFETWSKINKPSGWLQAESCLKDSVIIFAGNYSCSHICQGSSSICLGQTIPVVAGNEYQFSLSFRTSESTTGNGARIWCYWKDGSGNNISDPLTDNILRPSKYMKSESWKDMSIDISAPLNAASIYLEVRTYPGSCTWWDNIYFGAKTATGIKEQIDPALRIYPVPARDIINIESSTRIIKAEIINMQGIIVLTAFPYGEYTIRLSLGNLPAGSYIVRLFTSNNVHVRKISRQND